MGLTPMLKTNKVEEMWQPMLIFSSFNKKNSTLTFHQNENFQSKAMVLAYNILVYPNCLKILISVHAPFRLFI
jgi:hypothetical protein